MNGEKQVEKILTVDGKEMTPEKEAERKQQLEAAKAELNALLEKGEISGAEYNPRVIDLEMPRAYVAKHKMSRKQKIILFAIMILVCLAFALPGMIYLNWRYYYNNSLNSRDVPDYSDTYISSPEAEPIQVKVKSVSESGEFKGRQIRIFYKFYYDMSGVVTSVHDYWGFDDYATLVPRDVCVAWGSLKDLYLNQEASFSQVDRHCYGKMNQSGLDPSEIFTFKTPFGQTRSSASSMSNNHLIASTVEIRDQILDLKAGDEVRVSGYLVRVEYGGIALDSSTVRQDTGNGACEVIYVTKIENHGQKTKDENS